MSDGMKDVTERTAERPTEGPTERPWGTFETLIKDATHHVKRIVVNPAGRLSLQKHQHRAEHWVVASGTAQVTVQDTVLTLTANQHVFIPRGAVHRLENLGTDPVVLIEVQLGDYFGEDDIVRLDDAYGRS